MNYSKNKNVDRNSDNNSFSGNNYTKDENDNINIVNNNEIEFNTSKMNNFEYSFMERKSIHNSQKKLEIPHINSNNASKSKNSYLIKSDENSAIIKNVDKIFSTYYEENKNLTKINNNSINNNNLSKLPKISKNYKNNTNNLVNNKKLKINLPIMKKELVAYYPNLSLSPLNNNANYSSVIKESKKKLNDISTKDNLITNQSSNYLNTSINNKGNIIDRHYQVSPMNNNYPPVANIFSKKITLNNNSGKIKKIKCVNSNQ